MIVAAAALLVTVLCGASEPPPAEGAAGGLLGREVLERLQGYRQDYYPRLETEQGRKALSRRLDSVSGRLGKIPDKPTGVTEEHLGTMRQVLDVTVKFDAALNRAVTQPSPETQRELQMARDELRTSGAKLQGLPDVLKPQWERERPDPGPTGPGGGPPSRRRPWLGNLMSDLGDAPGARQAFDQTLAADPNNAAALGGRAGAAFSMGDFPAAYSDARRALALNPADRGALTILKLAEGRGAGAGGAGKPAAAAAAAAPSGGMPGSGSAGPAPQAAARTAFDLMSSADTLEAGRWNREALAAARLGDRRAALAAADRALAAYSANPVPYMVRGRFLMQDRDYRAALDAAEAGLRASPGDRALLSLKARAANRLKDGALAGEAAESLLAMNASDPEGLANLAHSRGLAGDREGMLALLRRAEAADGSYKVSVESVLPMPPGSDELFLFPGETPSPEFLAALEKSHRGETIAAVVRRHLGMGLLLALVLFVSGAAVLRGIAAWNALSRGGPRP